ncbi:1-acyl-sn-glycerol-3-phosphate acyltransferase [Treponema phagedenis]|uniref:1-acyl-sn-glycerol-3-phosphate acyltransferase n=1 Tax=Treponema phagedenis TaxID=162 RepID=A0A0B7GYV1_TREPH|nr:1-acyl-sn-glycerol-3-phosphate acyltransferase [Treponema phagedenis]NVP25479.1 1-acyl-sn-glycerol-3-phosphate acyltransferase [Treponema phagedenis]QEJ93957.1 1-acyl-sn-glycerol-3-phosphate acyltransferase [Treponema phagedenis]QEJ96721.1 1-acyl-sn-glycerol-3-phosphate acyltransferase [Treponema phagedenis]QEJ96792.1 1-acyl-sn-glycerol-3-phosphate acyltransferase [Treponema phagedenis]QEJ96881.1 1-acyl-sn-glycerol-3-phosphate acyltransferase [Treponema phagedenis]
MEKRSLEEQFKDVLPLLEKYSRKATIVDETTVLQTENTAIRKIIDSMMTQVLLPGSEMRGTNHIQEFLKLTNEGKKGIILAEHYSNFDLPCLLHLMENGSAEGKELSKKIIAIAGMKLSEDNKYVSALAEAYDRIVIYPSRTLNSITDEKILADETLRSRKINLAAMKALEKERNDGRVVLVFPSGTRYRPGKPETKRGLREIDSYIRTSDVMMLISINGNCLRISDDPSNMMGDIVCKDKIVMEASTVFDTATFREDAMTWHPDAEDRKQNVVDYVMHILAQMHDKNEEGRLS